MFTIRLGVTEMETVWINLSAKARKGILGKDKEKLSKKLGKAFVLLAN